MKKILIIILCSTTFFCPKNAFSQNNNNEVDTFQLTTVRNAEKEDLYRINTKTGEVWVYGEFVVLDENQLTIDEKAKGGLKKLIEQAKKQGKQVYTLPCWRLTDEKPSEIYTVH
ncbi:MAG: hypothetical protein Q8O30_02605 [Candidatus Omnitrophota bacterium]|nr:hypothetical protein [Candidatus Omnitrophota bacterium]